MSEVLSGTVKWFDPAQGYGFIRGDGDLGEVFVHFKGILSSGKGRRNLNAGERVKFEMAADSNGKRAVRVTRAP